MASTFHLQIVTPEGLVFDDQADSVVLRTTEGDVGIMANHIDFMSGIMVGPLKVKFAGKERTAAVSGGFISTTKELVNVVVTTFEWANEIDVARAEKAKELAKAKLVEKISDFDSQMAELKLKRALNRINITSK
ncbi:MAG: ATP synthase F1 subunit epsilon [Oscillospiraceae bacterium]